MNRTALDQTAAPPGSARSPDERSQQFVAVEGGPETTSASTLLVAAYGVMWVLLFGFVASSIRRQRRLEQRIADLEGALRTATERNPNRSGGG